MVMQHDAIASVIENALSAMSVVAIVALVGYTFALYPKADPYLSSSALKFMSVISNSICLPALIVSSLGSSLSVNLISRMGILILFSFFNGFISYTLASTVGKLIDQDISQLYLPIYVAIGSPNIVSLPLMVLSTLCEQDIVNGEYDFNKTECFAEASTMVFVYSIGWHLIYWSYGFPILKGLASTDLSVPTIPTNIHIHSSNNQDNHSKASPHVNKSESTDSDHSNSAHINPKTSFYHRPPHLLRRNSSLKGSLHLAFFDFQQHLFKPLHTRNQQSSSSSSLQQDTLSSSSLPSSSSTCSWRSHPYYLRLRVWCVSVLLSPLMVCIYIGTFIGLISPLQNLFFGDSAPLKPIGSALVVLGSPTVCLNSLIMSASLARVDLGLDYNRFMNNLEAKLFGTTSTDSTAAVSSITISTNVSPADDGDGLNKDMHDRSISKSDDDDHVEFSPLHNNTSSKLIQQQQYQQKKGLQSIPKEFIPLSTSSKTNASTISIVDATKILPPQLQSQHTSQQLEKRPHWRSVLALFLCRLILPAIFTLLLVRICVDANIIDGTSDKMLRLVVILESCAPPAQLIIVSLNQLSLARVAGGVAYLYIFIYSASVLTMTFWATVAIYTIY